MNIYKAIAATAYHKPESRKMKARHTTRKTAFPAPNGTDGHKICSRPVGNFIKIGRDH